MEHYGVYVVLLQAVADGPGFADDFAMGIIKALNQYSETLIMALTWTLTSVKRYLPIPHHSMFGVEHPWVGTTCRLKCCLWPCKDASDNVIY
jgi:hypothetical protein